jgi:hypothetical protein
VSHVQGTPKRLKSQNQLMLFAMTTRSSCWGCHLSRRVLNIWTHDIYIEECLRLLGLTYLCLLHCRGKRLFELLMQDRAFFLTQPCYSTMVTGSCKVPEMGLKGWLRLYRTRGQKQCPRAGCLYIKVRTNSGASNGRVVEGDRLT